MAHSYSRMPQNFFRREFRSVEIAARAFMARSRAHL